ncbi:MAG TPA: TIGR03435 family protein [Vicinamibacterales bacterium]|nr:TIGR03435 family protein [Vicinamibacterales bacterium]
MRRLSLAIGLTLLTAFVAAERPQSPDRPTFEVASIKPNKSAESRNGADAAPSGRVTVTNMTLYNLVRNAFELQPHELVSGERMPPWVESERWDIVAQGPPLKDPSSQQLLRQMLRNLLVDRFKLNSRRETREVPVYALVHARSDRQLGPQIRPSTLDCAAQIAAARAPGTARGSIQQCGRRVGPGYMATFGMSLKDFGAALSTSAGRFVIDATGLTDRFDLELKWNPEPGTTDAGAPADGASLFTALQEQLGLRLEARRAPVNVFVLETAERPEE